MKKLLILLSFLFLPIVGFADVTYDLTYPATRGNTYASDTTLTIAKRGETQPAPSGLLLDTYPSTVAYSLDKLSSTYSGSAIRVRRDSDDSEQDIGFLNNELDTVTLSNYCEIGGSTSILDQSSTPKTITASGAAKIDIFNPKFGIGSLTLPGNSKNDGLILSTGIADFGTNDFTIELWVNENTNLNNPFGVPLFDGRPDNQNGQYGLISINSSVEGNKGGITFSYNSGATSISSTNILTQNQWNHIAISRVSGTTRLFLNGNLEASTTDVMDFLDSQPKICLNAFRNVASGFSNLDGEIDDIRVIKGTGLYTTNFTPPTAPATDVTGTSLLLDFDQSGVASNGFVTTWYDQSGNGYDMIQSTVASQPKIYDSTTGLNVDSQGNPAVRFDGVNDRMDNLTINKAATFTSSASTFMLFEPFNDDFYAVFDNGSSDGWMHFNVNGDGYPGLFASPRLEVYYTGFPNSGRQLSTWIAGATYDVYLQGQPFQTGGAYTFDYGSGAGGIRIGNAFIAPSVSKHLDGNVQEIILYNTDQSANRTTIETNRNNRYNIYP